MLMNTFRVCFFIGIGCTILDLLFQLIFKINDVYDDIEYDISFKNGKGICFFPLKLSLLFIAVAGFGGCGWILLETFNKLSPVLIVSAAVLCAYLAAFLSYNFVFRPDSEKKRQQETSGE